MSDAGLQSVNRRRHVRFSLACLSDGHTAEFPKWKPNKKAAKTGARQLPFRAWILYRIRFRMAADLRDAGPLWRIGRPAE